MKALPKTKYPIMLRTDYSNDALWKKLCQQVQTPTGEFGFKAHIECISDPSYDNATVEHILEVTPKETHPIIFVLDKTTFDESEHPILCIDLLEEPGRSFRVIPSSMWGVENNLSIGNLTYEELEEALDEDGVLREI